jgi:hypothetical protein
MQQRRERGAGSLHAWTANSRWETLMDDECVCDWAFILMFTPSNRKHNVTAAQNLTASHISKAPQRFGDSHLATTKILRIAMLLLLVHRRYGEGFFNVSAYGTPRAWQNAARLTYGTYRVWARWVRYMVHPDSVQEVIGSRETHTHTDRHVQINSIHMKMSPARELHLRETCCKISDFWCSLNKADVADSSTPKEIWNSSHNGR